MARYAKIEKYLSSRLWNARLDGRSISLTQLMEEVERFHDIDLDNTATNYRVRRLIARIRRRIARRYCEWKARRRQWAAILGVPEELIETWYKEGLIRNKGEVDRLKAILADDRRVRSAKL